MTDARPKLTETSAWWVRASDPRDERFVEMGCTERWSPWPFSAPRADIIFRQIVMGMKPLSSKSSDLPKREAS
jgi:hypothetical protein